MATASPVPQDMKALSIGQSKTKELKGVRNAHQSGSLPVGRPSLNFPSLD